MGRFGLSSNDDSDDEVLMYPQDHGGDERTSSTGRDQTLSNRALSTLVHPVPGVAVEDTSSSSSSSIREAMRRNEYYDFTIRGNHHACDQYGPLYEYARVRPGNEEACSSRRRRSSKTYFYYWKQFVFVMLLIVMQRYLPPPPPPVDSWGGYISHSTQGIKATITNLVALTMYIVKGCIHNINEDLGMVMRSFLFRQGKPNIPISQDCIPCPLKVPIDNRDEPNQSLESIRNTLQSNFVGKSAEIDILSKALVKWDSSSLSNKRPLNMIFVGSDGVGKYEVAKQVGELLIHHDCQSDCNNPCSSCVSFHPSHILHLQGINHALNEESCAKSLIRQILNHVYKQKNEGAVVILRHVEDLGDAAKRELIRLLRMPNVTFSVQDDDDDDTMVSGASVANSNLLERFLFGKEDKSQMIPTRKEVVVRLDNCVFLFTTDLGSDEIFRGLSNSAFEASGLLLDQVARDIQEKLQRFFGVNFEMFDAIVPFWPLQYVEIKDIIKYKVNERSSRYKIELLDSALDHLAGPSNVDYMELKMIGAGDFDSFIFATRGGHDLVYEPIIHYIEEKLEADVFHHDEEVTRVGYLGDGVWTMEQCDREGLLCIDKGHFQLEAEQFI